MNIVGFLVQLVVASFLLRLWLQLVQANYYNPASQWLVRILAPVLSPLQKLLPPIGRFNTAAMFLAVLAMVLYGYFLVFVYIPWWQLLIWAVLQTISTALSLLFWLIIGSVIASWLAPKEAAPVVALIMEAVSPVIDPVRRLLPSIAGLDFSPVVVFLVIQLIRSQVLFRLYELAGVPAV